MSKLLLFTLIFTLVGECVSAQHNGYEKSIEIGGVMGFEPHSNKSFEVTMINGYRFNNLFAGIGVGFTYTDALYYKSYNYGASYTSRTGEYLVPVYATIKYNMTKHKISPFIAGNVGYAINVGGKTKAVDGLFIEPRVGVDFRLNSGQSIYFSVGYNMQDSKYNTFYISDYRNEVIQDKSFAGGIAFRVGFQF